MQRQTAVIENRRRVCLASCPYQKRIEAMVSVTMPAVGTESCSSTYCSLPRTEIRYVDDKTRENRDSSVYCHDISVALTLDVTHDGSKCQTFMHRVTIGVEQL